MTPLDPHVELVDDARLRHAIEERTRGRLLALIDSEDATLVTTLRTLAERGDVLVLSTRAGHRVRGRVVAVAGDHVVVTGEHGTSWVALGAVVTIRPRPGARIRADGAERDGVAGRPLPEALRVLQERAAEVHVLLPGCEAVRGRLAAVGRDVLSLASDVGGEHTLVPVHSIVAVTAARA